MRELCHSAAARPFFVQVADIVRLLDAKEVWDLRNKYARLRPTGWRSDSAAKVPPRCEATRTHGTGWKNAFPRSGSPDLLQLRRRADTVLGEGPSSPCVT